VSQDAAIIIGLFLLSIVSGMLGLGVAFAAVPFLGLFFSDLVHQVQPLSLLLNGLTALFSTLGFARSGYVDWKKALLLSVATTIPSPLGAILAQDVRQIYIWYIYLAAVVYLVYRLFKPVKSEQTRENFKLAFILAIPISILAGFLGVGPGFLLMPTLILLGFEPKKAAGINAWAVTPPSFSAFIPHIKTAQLSWGLTLWLLLVGAMGSFLGARISSLYIPGKRIKQLFGILILLVTIYKVYTLFR